ncbi:uncharacterized protein LOC106647899 [Copidosoma floridanum]|uniref:uncharacterized protein LOC106647899 n=1 Tax=Copidosoma floridanum TaxID=29053 RepID=UPI0006C9BA92|nr:uncharacterized protein LOC106647899 [Copidosoma floridanum]
MSVSGTASPRLKADLYLASLLYDGVEDTNLRQVTTLLKNKEADPNVLMPMHGITPFHLVIGNDSESFAEEVTKLFLRYGGNPNIKSVDGMTPVHIAAAWGRTRILELLLANGGDPFCLDCDYYTPFTYAFQGEHHDAINVLSKYCASSEERDEDIQYRLELDKVLLNNGEVLAEYLVSDGSISDSYKSGSSTGSYNRYDSKSRCGYVSEINSLSSNSMNSYFVTLRKNQRKRAVAQKVGNIQKIQEKENYDFSPNTMQEELKLLSRIISQLSNSLTSEVDASNYTYQSHESECIVSNEINSPKRMQMIMTFNRPVKNNTNYNKHRQNQRNINENHTSIKTLQPIKQHNNVPKLKENWKSATGPRKLSTFLSTKNCSTSSSAKNNTSSQSKPHTPSRDSLHSHWFDETIISKSPNLHVTVNSNKRNKNIQPKIPVLEKNASPLSTKVQKKPITITHKKVMDNSTNKPNSKSYTPGSRIPRPKTVVKKSKVTTKKPAKPKVNSLKKVSEEKKTRYYSPQNVLYSMSESSALSWSNDYLSKNPEERRKSLKEVAVNLSNRMDDCEEDEVSTDKSCTNIYKNTNTNFNMVLERLDLVSGVQLLDSAVKSSISDSQSEYTTNEESTGIREPTIDLNQAVIDSLQSTQSTSKFSDLDVGSLRRGEHMDPLDSMLGQQGSSSSISSDSYISVPGADNALSDNSQNIVSINKNNNCDSEPVISADGSTNSSRQFDSQSFLSVQEEYKYKDPDEGVVLLERRLYVSPSYTSSSMSSFYSISTAKSESLPTELYLLDNGTLRERLKSLGENPGPVTSATYHLYLKRLHKLESGERQPTKPVQKHNLLITNNQHNQLVSLEREKDHLRPMLVSIDWVQRVNEYEELERKVFLEFSNPHPSRKWREGTSKSSFNYLLLDPRITKDLPRRAASMSLSEKWETFLSAIFYVGKGKQSRPYAHLYEAFKLWVCRGRSKTNNSKLQRILDIWDEGKGVVMLRVFQNTIPVEAYTREAAMIEVLSTNKLGNCKSGDYYGVVATWRAKEKCELGRYMLFKAMQILLLEGERQIFPDNV